MTLVTSARINEEVDVEVEDDDVVAYVLGDPELIDRILQVHYDGLEPEQWAQSFYNADAVDQEKMLASLRRVSPYLTVEFRK